MNEFTKQERAFLICVIDLRLCSINTEIDIHHILKRHELCLQGAEHPDIKKLENKKKICESILSKLKV